MSQTPFPKFTNLERIMTIFRSLGGLLVGKRQGMHNYWMVLPPNPHYFPTKMLEKKVKMLIAQSFLTLCDPLDCSAPCSSIHWIPQAIILEWVPIFFSIGSVYSQMKASLPLFSDRWICSSESEVRWSEYVSWHQYSLDIWPWKGYSAF